MLLDVYTFTKDLKEEDLPKTGNYYVVAKNGTFIHKDTPLLKGFVKVDEIKGLGHLTPRIQPNLPKLPVEVIYKSLRFFQTVWDKYKSESAVVLYYNQELQEYYLYCPYQTVSSGSVDYDTDFDVNNEEHLAIVNWFTENNYRRVGTIHSHCNFGAFHSGTDIGDEDSKNGIHLTIGHVDQENFSLVSSFAVNGNRFEVSPPDVVSGLVAKNEKKNTGYGGGYMKWSSPDRYFNFELSDEERAELEERFMPEIIDDWMPLVEKKTYTYSSWNGGGYYGGTTSYGKKPVQTEKDHRKKSESPKKEVAAIPGTPPTEDDLKGDLTPLLSNHTEDFLRKVKSHAIALRSYSENIPASRLTELMGTLRQFFDREKITADDVKLACRVNVKERTYDAA